jgi:hypothetical protein
MSWLRSWRRTDEKCLISECVNIGSSEGVGNMYGANMVSIAKTFAFGIAGMG